MGGGGVGGVGGKGGGGLFGGGRWWGGGGVIFKFNYLWKGREGFLWTKVGRGVGVVVVVVVVALLLLLLHCYCYCCIVIVHVFVSEGWLGRLRSISIPISNIRKRPRPCSFKFVYPLYIFFSLLSSLPSFFSQFDLVSSASIIPP